MILEIGGDYPCSQEKDMDSEMRNLAFLLDQISTGPISKVREMYRLAKGILSSKTNSRKRDKSYWEHVSITHRKIHKSSSSSSESGSGSSSRSGSGSHRRGRLPRAPRGTIVIGHLDENQYFIAL
ncbi:hypothetical protein M9H77_27389 [Catharanthus roseus]|uniref:Uncharacterized protein n=1 Tax=Catharanthus roseus TaxID=4058 RepID=A0ACC0ADD1_CATRO|nr:hypothetical protein M9H77_27389 [Catharanthus roseus]